MPLGNKLREYGVPVVGPGARPYKKRHFFASLAEQVCAYIESPSPELVVAAERELFFLIQNLTGKANFKVFSYSGRRILFRLLFEGIKLKEIHEGAKDWLLAASKSFQTFFVLKNFCRVSLKTFYPSLHSAFWKT